MKNEKLNLIKIVILGALLSGVITFAASWSAPTATYPGSNLVTPINATFSNQNKAGALGTGPLEVSGQSLFYGNVNILGSAVEICTNGIDDNGNGLIDSADPGCGAIQSVFLYDALKKLASIKLPDISSTFKTNVAYAGLSCSPACLGNETCNNGVCVVPATPENWKTAGTCADGIDNDGNGDIDMNDVKCPIALSFSANKTTITNSGDPVVLAWNVSNATSCTASLGWSGSKTASEQNAGGAIPSSETVYPTTNPTTYKLICSNLAPSSSTRTITISISTLPPAAANTGNLYVSGKVGIGSKFTTSLNPLVMPPIPAESLEISGNMKIYPLVGTGTSNLCTDSVGRLVRC